ncbi:MAG: hypothetical protein FWD05_00965 [Oscillospiraceae bacterium]|nr:hypothetical protein [Oscillospiraceae bacterium]
MLLAMLAFLYKKQVYFIVMSIPQGLLKVRWFNDFFTAVSAFRGDVYAYQFNKEGLQMPPVMV